MRSEDSFCLKSPQTLVRDLGISGLILTRSRSFERTLGTGLIGDQSSVHALVVKMKHDLSIGTTLKRMMREQSETLASLSKSTGVPKSTISEWLGNRTPNPVQAVKVANHLGVSLHFLLFGEDDAQEPFQKIMKEDFFKGTFEISVKRIKVRGEG